MFKIVMSAWEKRLKQPLRPIYAPGVGGQIATQRLLAQPSDGYKCFDAITNVAVTTFFGQSRNYSLKDLHFFGTVAVEPSVLLVRKDSRFTNIWEFLKEARGGATPLKVGVGGSRTFYHLVSAAFKKEARANNMSLIIYSRRRRTKP